MYRVGVDVGGTFTDVVAVDDDGSVTLAKAASTPEDQSIGVMAGLERLAENLHFRMQSPAGCVSAAADQWKTSELQRNDANHVPAKMEISLQ